MLGDALETKFPALENFLESFPAFPASWKATFRIFQQNYEKSADRNVISGTYGRKITLLESSPEICWKGSFQAFQFLSSKDEGAFQTINAIFTWTYMNDSPPLEISAESAGKLLSTSSKTVRNLISRKKLKAKKVAGKWFVDYSSLLTYQAASLEEKQSTEQISRIGKTNQEIRISDFYNYYIMP